MDKAAGILRPLPRQYPISFLNFFKASLLDDSAAAPARVIADRALKKENQEWELVREGRGLGDMERHFSLIAIEAVFYLSKLKQAIQSIQSFPPPINCI